MTNKEISGASLLDIIFEHRNKNYGAYALRKTYPKRLRSALGVCLGISLLLLMINFIGRKNNGPCDIFEKGEVQLIEIPPDKPKQPEQPKPMDKTQNAQVKNTTIVIAPDNKADKLIPTLSDIDSATISDHNVKGKFSEGPKTDTTTTVNITGTIQTDNPPIFSQHEAAFPGGKEAFAQFLRDRLNTPDELEAGQKQTVLVRFMVDVDGTISKTEIVQSGGNSFDREVMRVLKKMPKWIPAEQNNIKVPVYFTQLVTFMGVEQ